jgi:hypothetical protein
MLQLARGVDEKEIQRIVLGPPYATRGPDSDGVYRLQLDMKKVATVSVRLFGTDSAYATPAAAD